MIWRKRTETSDKSPTDEPAKDVPAATTPAKGEPVSSRDDAAAMEELLQEVAITLNTWARRHGQTHLPTMTLLDQVHTYARAMGVATKRIDPNS